MSAAIPQKPFLNTFPPSLDSFWRETYERSPAFKEGQRFRAGIEARISVLFRGRSMKRCLAEGHQGFELLVDAAVLANNLMRIAALLDKRTRRKRKAA